MKYLITGANGQLGKAIFDELYPEEELIVATPDREFLDLDNMESIKTFFKQYRPNVIFNCGAYTNIEAAESDIANCMKTNYLAARILRDEARKIGAKLIQISTPYVFNGRKDSPYEIDDEKHAVNIYGVSKSLAEDEALKYPYSFVVRTSWLFGDSDDNIIKQIINSENPNESMYSGQISSPTYTKDLAKFLVELSKTGKYGIYHATNSGACTYSDLVNYVLKLYNGEKNIGNINNNIQKNWVLGNSSLTNNGFELLPDWQDAVSRYIDSLKEEKLQEKKEHSRKLEL